jgi:hypothetical protein
MDGRRSTRKSGMRKNRVGNHYRLVDTQGPRVNPCPDVLHAAESVAAPIWPAVDLIQPLQDLRLLAQNPAVKRGRY